MGQRLRRGGGLAAILDFDACGIEAEEELVEPLERLADDYDLPVRFACGSFLPAGKIAEGEFAWLVTDGRCGHRELGLDPEDFDVIYAYPWPDEERLTAEFFACVARPARCWRPITVKERCVYETRR